jgi:hypothetical protein
MQRTNHPIRPEELMAYLDGELPADRAVDAAAHLEQCPECRRIADGLRDVSQSLSMWEIESAAARISERLNEELRERSHAAAPPVVVKTSARRWFGLHWWAWAVAGACAVVICLVTVRQVATQRALEAERSTGLSAPADLAKSKNPLPTAEAQDDSGVRLKSQFNPAPSPPAAPAQNVNGPLAPLGPLIARTAQLQLTTREFDHIRDRVDAVMKKHKGYFGELTVNTPAGSGRTLTGKLQVPADQLDGTLSDLRPLGHVDQESQSGEEVTAAYTDLEARLANSRHTEQRIIDVLRERTGKLSDILEAEEQLSRVRGQIEQMEAEKRGLLKRVDYSTLNLTVNEEYKTPLQVSDSLPTQFRNAAVDGFRSMAGSLMGVALFLLSGGPVVLLWIAILFFPARWAWRRWRRAR